MLALALEVKRGNQASGRDEGYVWSTTVISPAHSSMSNSIADERADEQCGDSKQ
jgi:hypothetical protein